MRTVQKFQAFDANAKLLNFTEKLKTASGKYRVNMVTKSSLPFRREETALDRTLLASYLA